jgi:16S rRNA (cytidine1402-2'-O)-methyltransferase
VQAALSENISITVVPGANAATAALCLSGLEPAPFLFLGFLPQKGKRGKVEEWKNHSGTIVLYEAPHRLVETLALLAEVWGDRKAAVVRELTKKFEEAKRGPLSELQAYYEANEPRGEITLVVQGASDDAVAGEDIEKELAAALAKFSLKEAVQYVAGATGAPRKEVYKRALEMQKK